MPAMIIGTSAFANADVSLMRQAGIGWVRHGFPMPFADRLYGEVSDRYHKAKEEAEAWLAGGIEVMGVSPGPGHGTFEPDATGGLKMVWHSSLPEWFGAPGSAELLRNYEAVCAWLARDLQGIVRSWQIANELEIRQFAGPLDLRQACDFVLAGARGLKAADPSLFVGPNSGGAGEAYYLYGRLYADPAAPRAFLAAPTPAGTPGSTPRTTSVTSAAPVPHPG